MGQNPKCLRRVFLPPSSPVLANIHSILAYDVPDTEYVGLPTKFRFNFGPALQSIAGSMSVNRLRRWPSTNLSRVCCMLCANTCHSTNTVSMLTHSLRRWPVIETALGDCTVFSDCCIMLVTFKIPAPETPDNTIHWPNADVMLSHRLRRWANIIPTKTLLALNHNYNREYYYFWTLAKNKSTKPWNVIFDMFIRIWCTEMSAVSHTQHPSFT